MLNQVTLVGKITADPVLKESPNGRPFSTITLEVKSSFRDPETREFEAELIDIDLWGFVADKVVNRCGAGSIISVGGRLVNRILDFPGEQTFRTIGAIGDRVSFIQLKAPNSGADEIEEGDIPCHETR